MDIPCFALQPVRVSGYRQLLDATIAHLEGMKEAGARSVSVSAKALAELAAAPLVGRKSAAASVTSRRESLTSASAPTSSSPPPAVVTSPQPIPAGVAARWNQALRPAVAARPASTAPLAAPPPLPAKLDPAARRTAMEDLRQRATACIRCPNLVSSRRSVVFGVGNLEARLMFVGEAPGADEDRQGEPFVGAAGELLTKIIGAMDLTRDRVFIANILKCRPDTPGQPTGNRKPTPEEMATCLPWLQEQIGLIQPEIMVALGATAVEGLLGKGVGITKLRGQWQSYRGIPLMPTYHPSYLLRTGSSTDKRKVWEDMLAVMERLAMPISARQRGFFLPRAAG